MRAALIETCGRLPVVADVAEPEPGPGEALVRVCAAPVTPLDLLCATGTSYFGAQPTPYVPGVQGVGTVVGTVGGTVGGRAVWFPTTAGMRPGNGSMAELAAVAHADLVALPDGADRVLVAALGLAAVAAHQALLWRGELAAGEQVIVLGAGGAVGQAGVQLARIAGARRVIAGTRSAAATGRAQRAGADAVVALDTDDVAELAARFVKAADGPVDLVLDPLFGVPAAAAARALRPGGRLVHLGGSASESCPIDSATLRGKSLRLLGYSNNELTGEQRAAALTFVAERSMAGGAGQSRTAGALTVDHETVPLDEAPAAWARQAAGAPGGRIVLVP